MLIRIISAKCIGIEAVKVTVEVDVSNGIGIHLVGLADIAVKESLLRTTTALESLGYRIPGKRIIINLAPADLHKSGSGYDIPIALGIIAASGQKRLDALDRYMVMGELGLNGGIRPVPGALPYAELAREEGLEGIILPEQSALEATEIKDINVFGVKTLDEVIKILEGREDPSDLLIVNSGIYRKMKRQSHHGQKSPDIIDFADIIGQEGAKRGIEIAAAGGHNVIMLGSPGSGKSSLAKALAGILPPMTLEESLTTSKIYSISGLHNACCGLMRQRPFRAPHCTASAAAIIGGGAGDNISPGEVTLAHNGVLFCDEMAQMPRSVIEMLRAPLEDRKVTISRLKGKLEFPASFMLVAASNPCPCGYWGDGDRCTCTPTQRLNYISRLSGPIMDRIDLHLFLRRVNSERILNSGKAESSEAVAARVLKARIIQKLRFAPERAEGLPIMTNAGMGNRQIEKYCPLNSACQTVLGRIMESMSLSMRAYFRIIRVARTIADLESATTGKDVPELQPRHISEAAAFRFLDKEKIFSL